MTHILVLQGTPSGGPPPRTLTLDLFQNVNTSYGVVLQYVNRNTLTLDRFNNAQTFYDVELETVDVTELTLGAHANTNTFYDVALQALPYEPDNAETDTLLAAFTGTYTTSRKIQIDRFITSLKGSGAWAQLDWFVCGRLTVNEHDSFVNWINPAQSLAKAGTPNPTYTAEVGNYGGLSTQSGHLKSGWNPTTGPHATTTSCTLFAKVASVANQNGLQLAGNFEYSSPGPSAPTGTWIILNPLSGNWNCGVNCFAFDGVSGAAWPGVDKVFAVTRDGAGLITASVDGVSAGTDPTAGHYERTSSDGMSIVGTPAGFLAGRAFPGVVEYAGWGAALSLAQLAGVVTAFATALLPPEVGSSFSGVLLINDDNDYLGDESGDYVITDGA